MKIAREMSAARRLALSKCTPTKRLPLREQRSRLAPVSEALRAMSKRVVIRNSRTGTCPAGQPTSRPCRTPCRVGRRSRTFSVNPPRPNGSSCSPTAARCRCRSAARRTSPSPGRSMCRFSGMLGSTSQPALPTPAAHTPGPVSETTTCPELPQEPGDGDAGTRCAGVTGTSAREACSYIASADHRGDLVDGRLRVIACAVDPRVLGGLLVELPGDNLASIRNGLLQFVRIAKCRQLDRSRGVTRFASFAVAAVVLDGVHPVPRLLQASL